MRILIESNRARTIKKTDGTPGLVKVAVGSHVTRGVHAVAYTTNSGRWGVLATKYTDSHACGGPTCAVKTEFLGVAAAVKTFVTWPTTLTFFSCVSKTTEMLTMIRENRVIPKGTYVEPLEELVTESFTRLSMNFWLAEHRLTAPSTEAKAMAALVHKFVGVRNEKTVLTSGLAQQLAGCATRAFAQR